MLLELVFDLGPWNWMLLGLILLILEILVPGVFLLWIGIAAILTGGLSLQLWDLGFWTWQVQVLMFLLLSLVSVFAGKRLLARPASGETDQPFLNQRAEQLIGRTATLEEAIVEGYGRIRLGDTLWRISGPDLPAGARVRVTAARDGTLQVEPI
ncbi:hypothetical protein L598_001100000750 [Mesorhizobium sp. J18]|uniref:NfeD family protein n=1 Tax=Mesorhizobium sp. J18 TaxID=935263 RepID=UPI00119AECBD|nr:NfeD family protein [Mesorhizobium sp. J18]TWH00159.1 hypothetical protein L598_001100000750 [Mesorhizobium sp. J18]